MLEKAIRKGAVGVLAGDEIAALLGVVGAQQKQATADLLEARSTARHSHLTEQMLVLWDGPTFKTKATGPADEIMLPMLKRSWHDARGAARAAKKDATDARLHKLRIRMKDLRYGCETLAFVDGRAAAKTAKAAQALQTQLGDVHDAAWAIDWFGEVGRKHPDLAEAAATMARVEAEARAAAQKGWKRQLKEVDRRWRRWTAR